MDDWSSFVLGLLFGWVLGGIAMGKLAGWVLRKEGLIPPRDHHRRDSH
jgi:hypothetical protein